jgi:hypothetical protein
MKVTAFEIETAGHATFAGKVTGPGGYHVKLILEDGATIRNGVSQHRVRDAFTESLNLLETRMREDFVRDVADGTIIL